MGYTTFSNANFLMKKNNDKQIHVCRFCQFFISYHATGDELTSGDESYITCDEGEVLSGDESATGRLS